MKRLLLLLLLSPVFQVNGQKPNKLIIKKLTEIENDTCSLISLIRKPMIEEGVYNNGLVILQKSINIKADTLFLKQKLIEIIQSNNDIFYQKKIVNCFLLDIEHNGESFFYTDILFLKTRKGYFGFLIIDGNIYKKSITKKQFKFVKITFNKTVSKKGSNLMFLIRELKPRKKTKAKLFMVDHLVSLRISKIEGFFADIIPLN